MSLTIEVKQEHIDKGCCHSFGGCPIALAIKELGYNNAWVSRKEISICESRPSYIPTPEVCKFIYDFDNHNDVEPQTFTLDKILEV